MCIPSDFVHYVVVPIETCEGVAFLGGRSMFSGYENISTAYRKNIDRE